nr:unnamed protein product [Callosobruchus chinensis]
MFYVAVIYIHPNISTEKYEEFFELLGTANLLHLKRLLFLGDFNCTHFFGNNFDDAKTRTLTTFWSVLDLQQFNNFLNSYGRVLDLVIGNINCVVTRDSVPLVNEDDYHPSLSMEFKATFEREKSSNFNNHRSNYTYSFRRANYISLYNALLTTNWTFLSNITDSHIAVTMFYDKIYEIFELQVPRIRTFKHNYPVWYNSDTIKLIKERAKVHKRYKMSGNTNHYHHFCELRIAVMQNIKAAYEYYLQNVQNQINQNPKHFWSYIHQKQKTSKIPGILHHNSNSYNDPRAIVNAFADFFQCL